MGTRINVLMDHDVDDYRDQAAVLARLTKSLPASLAVRDYWNANDPLLGPERQGEWTADLTLPYESYWRSYTAPGSLFLKVGPHTAKLRIGGRWRGFLTIPPLFQVHLHAFRAVAQALGAARFACFPDCEDVWKILYSGGSYEEAVPILEHYFGPPQPSLEVLSPEVSLPEDEAPERQVPYVWYSEKQS